MKTLIFFLTLLAFAGCSKTDSKNMNTKTIQKTKNGLDTATFAGGCFWCTEASFMDLDGVYEVTSGYTGGNVDNPTYEQVCTGTTGHYEAIQILFDPKTISYSELVDIFWRQIDPTDSGGSFVDRGSQYQSAIFYHTASQKKIAEASKIALERSGIFNEPIDVKIFPATTFFKAEEYHQQFCKKSPVRYYSYRSASGRDNYIRKTWGEIGLKRYKKLRDEELKKALSEVQYKVTTQCGTEPPFDNAYWNNKKEGVYVDVISGEPLFSSRDKFDSGTGWPSFTKPIDARYIVKKTDSSLFMNRTEVRSKDGDAHLGHVFDDGPSPANLRYCINSASLKFIPKDEMEKEGYGYLLFLFNYNN